MCAAERSATSTLAAGSPVAASDRERATTDPGLPREHRRDVALMALAARRRQRHARRRFARTSATQQESPTDRSAR